MQEFDTPNPHSRIAKYRTLIVAACIVLVGGGVFAAGGGAEVVKRWFIQVHFYGPDGQVIEGVLEATGEDGNVAVMEMDIGDGEPATVTVERMQAVELNADTLDGEVEGEISMVTVSLGTSQVPPDLDADTEGEPREISMTLSSAEDFSEPATGKVAYFGQTSGGMVGIQRSYTITDEIPEPVELFEWTDDGGQTHELSIVRNLEDDPDGDGFKAYTTLAEDVFLQVGSLSVDSAEEVEVLDFDVDENGVGFVTFVDADGGELLLEMKTLGADLDGLEMTRVESHTESGLKTFHLRKVEEPRE